MEAQFSIKGSGQGGSSFLTATPLGRRPVRKARGLLRHHRVDVETLEFSERVASSSSISEAEINAAHQKDALSKELVALDSAFYEDYGQPLNSESRLGVECFFKYHAQVGFPMLSAESSGAILATWSKGNQHVTLRFLDKYHLHFAITTGVQRTWGEGHAVAFLASHPEASDIIA